MTRAVAYIRCSTDHQADGRSLPDQAERIAVWCEAEGRELLAVFLDAGVSGATLPGDREGFAAALDAAKALGAGLLVADEPTRLGRGTLPQADAELQGQRAGVALVTADGQWNGEDSTERMIVKTVAALSSELHRRHIASKTSAALRAKRERGEPVGRAPFGKRWQDGELVDDPDAAPAVRRLLELRAEGLSYEAVAEALNNEGVAPPGRSKRWYPTQVGRVLSREADPKAEAA